MINLFWTSRGVVESQSIVLLSNEAFIVAQKLNARDTIYTCRKVHRLLTLTGSVSVTQTGCFRLMYKAFDAVMNR